MRTAVQSTSINAYQAHCGQGKAAAQRNMILQFIRDKGGDWSIGEIAHELGLQKSTIAGRVNELINQTCELIECTKRKDRVSGITVRPVMIPRGQMDMFA